MATGSVKKIKSGSNGFNGNGKRTFIELRKDILKCLSKGQNTVNHISNETNINWKTVDNHLTYLRGRGLINEVFSSEYVRIYELSEDGKEYVLREFPQKKLFNNKIISNKMILSKRARL